MALNFVKATGQYVTIGATAALQNVAASTITCWIKATSFGPDGNRNKIISVSTNAASTRFSIAWDSAAKGIGALGKALDGDALFQWNSNYALNNAQWYHVAVRCTFTTGIYSLYVDGVNVANSAAQGWTKGNTSNTISAACLIGGNVAGNGEFFDGIIDDLRVYNIGLTTEQIMTMFVSKGIDNITSGLYHQWRMNEGYEGLAAAGAARIKDNVGNLNGTPGNNPVYIGSPLKLRK